MYEELAKARTGWRAAPQNSLQIHTIRHIRSGKSEELRISTWPTAQKQSISLGNAESVEIQENGGNSSLLISFRNSTGFQLHGIDPGQARQVEESLNLGILRATREQRERAKHLQQEIDQALRASEGRVAKDRYLTHSEAEEVRDLTGPLIERAQEMDPRHLEEDSLRRLERVHRLTEEGARQEANEEFTRASIPRVKDSTVGLFSNPLTDEQAGAIATDEDCTLVLAGAGTGKTAVIIGKIAHLVRNEGVEPGSILALAFNREAALEIRNRLPEDLKGVRASTFHSFALGIVAGGTGIKPSISPMATDEFQFRKAIDSFLAEMAQDPDMARRMVELLGNQRDEYKAPFQFRNEAAYREFTRNTELRALNGRMVKSFEELTIANFLTASGINFEYEEPYELDTASERFRQYFPDFHISEPSVYIEHFAMDRDGNPPEGWDGYAEGAEWKRRTHLENGTTLLETYSWQHEDGTLREELERQLRELGVEFKPIGADELIQKMSKERISWLAVLLGTFLNHVKSEGLEQEDLEDRTGRTGDRSRARNFLQVFAEVRRRYQEVLERERTMDFHDLVIQATRHLRIGENPAKFTHILIDEFQDISRGRMEMAKALWAPGARYFVVGDDWQSIYRFAGSDVSLILNCDKELGHTQRRDLTLTFRYGEGIAGPSNAFIQANPEQSRRTLGTLEGKDDRGVTVIAGQQPAEGVRAAVQDILGPGICPGRGDRATGPIPLHAADPEPGQGSPGLEPDRRREDPGEAVLPDRPFGQGAGGRPCDHPGPQGPQVRVPLQGGGRPDHEHGPAPQGD